MSGAGPRGCWSPLSPTGSPGPRNRAGAHASRRIAWPAGHRRHLGGPPPHAPHCSSHHAPNPSHSNDYSVLGREWGAARVPVPVCMACARAREGEHRACACLCARARACSGARACACVRVSVAAPEIEACQQRRRRLAQQLRQPPCAVGPERLPAAERQRARALGAHGAHRRDTAVGGCLPRRTAPRPVAVRTVDSRNVTCKAEWTGRV